MLNPNQSVQPGQEFEFTSLVRGNPLTGGDVLKFTSLAQRQAPIEEKVAKDYAQMKGLPVKFRTDAGRMIDGVLIQWNDPNSFRVLGMDGNTLTMRVLRASELYSMPENPNLKGAVEFIREHSAELADTRAEIHKMLKPSLAPEQAAQAKEAARLAPMPVKGEKASELEKLSQEKVVAWLDHYKGDLRTALPAMFGLATKYRMTEDELALFMEELKNPAHLQQRTFFTLENWLKRAERNSGKTVEIKEATVVDSLLDDIVNNRPPAEMDRQKAA